MQHFHIFSLLFSVSVSIEIYYFIITCHGRLLCAYCLIFSLFCTYNRTYVNNKSVFMLSYSAFLLYLVFLSHHIKITLRASSHNKYDQFSCGLYFFPSSKVLLEFLFEKRKYKTCNKKLKKVQ